MGTLFEQQPREKLHISDDDWIDRIKELSKKHKLSVSEVVAALNLREQLVENDLRLRDGDIRDEQLAGFGDLLRQLVESIQELVEHRLAKKTFT